MLKRIEWKVVAVSLACLGAVACSHNHEFRTPHDQKVSDRINRNAAEEAEAASYTEIKFKPGSDQLTDESKAEIDALLRSARQKGKLDEIKVLAWADQEYPSKERKELSSAQKTLADKRGDHIEDYIDSFKYNVDVDKYNMASRPGLVARVFNTSDARFKKTLVAAGLPTTADEPKSPGKASRAIVMALVD